jgi:hypothetical protein
LDIFAAHSEAVMDELAEVQKIINENPPGVALEHARKIERTLATRSAEVAAKHRRIGEMIGALVVLVGEAPPAAPEPPPTKIRGLQDRIIEVLRGETEFLNPKAISKRIPDVDYIRVYNALFKGSRRNPALADDPRIEIVGPKGERRVRLRPLQSAESKA